MRMVHEEPATTKMQHPLTQSEDKQPSTTEEPFIEIVNMQQINEKSTTKSIGRQFLEIQEGVTELQRSQRIRTPNPKYANAIINVSEPTSYKQAINSTMKDEWIKSMELEISSLIKIGRASCRERV